MQNHQEALALASSLSMNLGIFVNEARIVPGQHQIMAATPTHPNKN